MNERTQDCSSLDFIDGVSGHKDPKEKPCKKQENNHKLVLSISFLIA